MEKQKDTDKEWNDLMKEMEIKPVQQPLHPLTPEEKKKLEQEWVKLMEELGIEYDSK